MKSRYKYTKCNTQVYQQTAVYFSLLWGLRRLRNLLCLLFICCSRENMSGHFQVWRDLVVVFVVLFNLVLEKKTLVFHFLFAIIIFLYNVCFIFNACLKLNITILLYNREKNQLRLTKNSDSGEACI